MADQKKRRRLRQSTSFAEDFKVVLNLSERLAEILRQLLHLDKASWDFCLDRLRSGNAYRSWAKSKGPGKGVRRFDAPCDELKFVQRAILDRFLLAIPVHSARHGNQRGASILTNAAAHRGHKFVFSTDIVNAFPMTNRKRIWSVLIDPLTFQLRQFRGVDFSDDDRVQMCEAVVDLTTYRGQLPRATQHGRLPQGPPTSPRIFDICCFEMDCRIWELAHQSSSAIQRFVYTAYADDLTVSSGGEISEEMQGAILQIVKDCGYIPHTDPRKTEYFSPSNGRVPVVTGIVIAPNDRLTMAPRKRDQIRGRLHSLNLEETWSPEEQGEVAGLLGFVRQLYPKGRKLPKALRRPVEAAEARIQALRDGRPITIEVDGYTVEDLARLTTEGEKNKPKQGGDPSLAEVSAPSIH